MIGALLWVGGYAFLRWSGNGSQVPPTPLLVLLGILSLLPVFILLGQLIPPARQLSSAPGEVFRGVATLGWIGLHAWVLQPERGASSWRLTLFHVDLMVMSMFLMLALAAQFVLPVRTLRERAAVMGRLLRHLAGLSGPVVFVHNGRVVESQGERERKGPGVVLVDYASAAVLRSDVKFTGTAGPGLTFTAPGERLAEALDLRCQIRTLPAEQPTTAADAEQHLGTSLAVTKDGIPVSAELSLSFILHPGGSLPPREGREAAQPPFDFYADAVGRAVYGHAFGAQVEIPWTRLPLLLAVDLWRDIVKSRDLMDLQVSPSEVSPLAIVKEEILTRLTHPTYLTSEPGGERARKASREFRLLHDRGIRVLGVEIADLHVPEDVRREHVLRWREAWSGAVHEVYREAEQKADENRRTGRQRALQESAADLTASLRTRLARGEVPTRRDTLTGLLQDAEQLCRRPEMAPEGTALSAELAQVQGDVLNLDADCQPAGQRRHS